MYPNKTWHIMMVDFVCISLTAKSDSVSVCARWRDRVYLVCSLCGGWRRRNLRRFVLKRLLFWFAVVSETDKQNSCWLKVWKSKYDRQVYLFCVRVLPWLRCSLLLRCVRGSDGRNLLSVGQQCRVWRLWGRREKRRTVTDQEKERERTKWRKAGT